MSQSKAGRHRWPHLAAAHETRGTAETDPANARSAKGTGPTPDAFSGDGTLSSDAYEELYRATWSAVVNYARFRVGPDDAADMAAEVFVKGWSARDQFVSERGTPERWLWGIARNMARDWRRRPKTMESLDEGLPANVDVANEGVRALTIQRVDAALRQLPEADREIISLRFAAGLSHRDVGGILGLTEAASAQRLHRAVTRLRTAVEGEESK